MLRTQIYLTEEESAGVAALAKATGRKQSEVIRAAVDAYLAASRPEALARAAERCTGLWAGREDVIDFEEVRASWDRDCGDG